MKNKVEEGAVYGLAFIVIPFFTVLPIAHALGMGVIGANILWFVIGGAITVAYQILRNKQG
jgi:hypothetical protein